MANNNNNTHWEQEVETVPENRVMTYRVSLWDDAGLSRCQEWPSPECQLTGKDMYQWMSIRFLQILTAQLISHSQNESLRIKFIGATSWDSLGDNRSVMALTIAGEADITAPTMRLTYPRSELLSYTRPTERWIPTLIYRNFSLLQRSLSLMDLIMKPHGLWLIFLFIFLGKAAIRRFPAVTANLLSDNQIRIGSGGCLVYSPSKNSIIAMVRISEKYKTWSWLLVGIFLSTLSNYFCIMFSYPTRHVPEFKDLYEVHQAMAVGKIRLIASSELTWRDLMSKVSLPNRALYRQITTNWPPMVMTVEEALPLLQQDTKESATRHVYVSIHEWQLRYLDTRICGLERMRLEMQPTLTYVSLFNAQTIPTVHVFRFISLNLVQLWNRAYRNIQMDWYHANGGLMLNCTKTVGGGGTNLEGDATSYLGGKYHLSLIHVLGLFYAFLMFVGISLLMLGLEMATERLSLASGCSWLVMIIRSYFARYSIN